MENYLRCQCLAGLPGEQCIWRADGEDMLCSECRANEDCVQARREAERRAACPWPRLA